MLLLDSGAHSLFKEKTKQKRFNVAQNDFSYYETDQFWEYVDSYAEFIKKHISTITAYVNVDIIRNAELTWKVQKYLEKTHKLKPLPVFHSHEDIKWLKKYIDNYDYVGIGGIGQFVSKNTWIQAMGNPIFDLICDTPNQLPRVKTHGFAIASPELFINFPFFSVDSASWVIYGKYGGVIIPKKTKGEYDYTKPPYLIKTSWKNHHINIQGTHIDNVTSIQREEFLNYFAYRNLPIGKSEFKDVQSNYKLREGETWFTKGKIVEVIIEEGLCNSYQIRDDANLYYFLDMEKQAKPYPWPWHNKIRRFV